MPNFEVVTFGASQRNLFVDAHEGELVLLPGSCRVTKIFSNGVCRAHTIFEILFGNQIRMLT